MPATLDYLRPRTRTSESSSDIIRRIRDELQHPHGLDTSDLVGLGDELDEILEQVIELEEQA